MTTIIISRKQAKIALETFTELWAVPVPEVVERKRIELGQRGIVFLYHVDSIVVAVNFYSAKTGGNLIWNAKLQRELNLRSYDTLVVNPLWDV